MAVSHLKICEWRGVTMQETIIDNPTWEKIEMAVRALNNQNLNDIYLNTISDVWLCVGGGDGQYLLSGAIGNDVFPTLIDDSRASTRKVSLTVGGQTGDYPENQIHTLTEALSAVRDFYESSGFSSNLNWAKC